MRNNKLNYVSVGAFVLAMIVGLSEVASAVNQELEDVASAFGSINQTYRYSGLEGHTGSVAGSEFNDGEDFCDSADDIVGAAATGEGDDFGHGR